MNQTATMFLLCLASICWAAPNQGVIDALDEGKYPSGEAGYRTGCALAGSSDEVCGERKWELEERRQQARSAAEARQRNQRRGDEALSRSLGSRPTAE
jgi:hypothetical protein